MVCDFTNQCIPIEVFGILAGFSIALSIFGFIRQPQIPASLAFGGMILFTLGAVFNNIEMGQLVQTSSLSGTTTSYSYSPDLFPLTGISKVITILIGAVMMLFGALMVLRAEDSTIW